MVAAGQGHGHVLVHLGQEGLAGRSALGFSVLHKAAQSGDVASVAYVLSQGSQVGDIPLGGRKGCARI
eukprot:scaffold2677_cov220-Pinguiococcus_pyrenoidosus.AAC.11